MFHKNYIVASLWYYAATLLLYLAWVVLKPDGSTGAFYVIAALVNGGFTISAMLFFISRVIDPEKTIGRSAWQALAKGYGFILILSLLASIAVFAFLTGGIYTHTILRLKDAVILGVSCICHHRVVPTGGDFYPGAGPYDYRTAYILQIVLGTLTLFGALGYLVCTDLFDVRRMRERMADPSRTWSRHVRFIINYLMIMTISATALFYFLERNRFLKGERLVEALISSYFHITMTIGTGYSSIQSPHEIHSATTLLLTLLLIIGNPVGSAGLGLHPEFLYSFRKPRAREYLMVILAGLLGVMLLSGIYFFGWDIVRILFVSTETFAHNWMIRHSEHLPPGYSTSLVTLPLFIAGKILMPALVYVYSHVFFHKRLNDLP